MTTSARGGRGRVHSGLRGASPGTVGFRSSGGLQISVSEKSGAAWGARGPPGQAPQIRISAKTCLRFRFLICGPEMEPCVGAGLHRKQTHCGIIHEGGCWEPWGLRQESGANVLACAEPTLTQRMEGGGGSWSPGEQRPSEQFTLRGGAGTQDGVGGGHGQQGGGPDPNRKAPERSLECNPQRPGSRAERARGRGCGDWKGERAASRIQGHVHGKRTWLTRAPALLTL